MKRLAKRVLLPPSGAHSMPVGIGRGIRMNFDFSRNTRLYAGLYEKELNRHLRRLLKPGTTAFDVGAQLGYYSLVIAGLTRSAVAAFECDPACVGVMERNLALNPALADVVELVPRLSATVRTRSESTIMHIRSWVSRPASSRSTSTAASWLFCAPRVAFSASGIPP